MITVPPYITINYDELCDNGIHIHSIWVHPDYRKQGLFKTFINQLAQAYDAIFLECWPTLVQMYEHLGFKQEGVQYDGYIEMVRKRK